MGTLLISHPCFVHHETPHGHPERPDRIRAVERILEHERFQPLIRESAPLAERADIIRAHPESYFDALEQAAPTHGTVQIDDDTSMSPGTWEAVLRGAGGHVVRFDDHTPLAYGKAGWDNPFFIAYAPGVELKK